MGHPDDKNDPLKRRELLGRGSALAFGMLLTGATGGLRAEEITAPDPQQAPVAGVKQAEAEKPKPPVNVAVIGLGDQGRALLTSLSYVNGAVVKTVCDTYEGAHKRAQAIHPKAQAVSDYKQVLADKTIQAVYVATPSHLHKQIVLDALAAGKHVYCEAPLASSVEDAKAIAQAAQAAAPKVIFHSGLQYRTNPQHHHVHTFVKTGALDKIAQVKAQWHKKTSWRRAAPTDARQSELNWRLRKATSGGLIGEVGIHQIDVASWYLDKLPKAVSGFGGTVAWRDGRDVPDTVQCVFEYDGGVQLAYDATLANSFDGAYELFQGTSAAVLLREVRAWMFKEADAPALGWEVYAYKEKLGDETGIALVADATKLLAEGKEPSKNRDVDPKRTPLYYASDTFLDAVRAGKPSECGPQEGYRATVVALKANEAVVN
ncbi:MAG TPA: Gfo/Idh/MocA family oxidoreductase, partial [Armatimonadaceae bacterium]|nr:Gfo/Idh/MocA family oxidoreductase [Armatimonadaceae bacterium]